MDYSLLRAQAPSWKKRQTDFKSQRLGRTEETQIWAQLDCFTHDLTAAVVACPMPAQEQASQYSSMEG